MKRTFVFLGAILISSSIIAQIDTTFHEMNGSIESIGRKKNGYKVGKWTKFGLTGWLVNEEYYSRKERKLKYYEYWPDKGVRKIILFEKNDSESVYKREGISYFYEVDGSLRSKIRYKSGKKHGRARYFHNNGQLEKRGQYKNGEMVGVWSYFDSAGRLVEKRRKPSVVEPAKELPTGILD